ncbi:MAG: UDP-N-acetylmuramate dehydrogenase [Candidatus Omnitrophica bacterium]|nr:UDP-N-acetylmuramate dehydrogenase [Candidatus Omnitrophota bacterium]
MNWRKDLNLGIKPNQLLKDKTTFRIGGKAEVFACPKDEEILRKLVIFARKDKLPVFILGAGSNILAADSGLKGLVIRLSSSAFTGFKFDGNLVRVGCGLMLTRLIQEARRRSLSGVERLTGIPGTVGGAMVMNAGAWGKSIADSVKEVTVMDYNGRILVIRKDNAGFVYRNSKLGKYIVLEAVLSLVKKDKRKIAGAVKKILAQRHQSQDNTLPNAGCIFKNPAKDSAGRLIDACGLKGRRAGRAVISKKHANFILNLGSAKSRDVLKLMELARRSVRNKFKVVLEPEIKIWC